MMTPRQRLLVQASFAKIAPIGRTLVQLFYARLFALDPSLRHLFGRDLKEQGRKLMHMIALAINGLDSLDQILPTLQELGRRHAGYGVEPRHYDIVGVALLWTIEQGLGAGYTVEVGEAWGSAYTLIADVMVDAAYSHGHAELVGA